MLRQESQKPVYFPVFYDDGAKAIYRHFIKTMAETGIPEIRAP